MAGINTKLDANQVIKQAYDEDKQRLRVDASVSASISDVSIVDSNGNELDVNPDGSINTNITGGSLQIEIDAADGDNVAISDGTNTMAVNPNGSINEANSANILSELQSIDNKLPALGPQTPENSVSVTLATDYDRIVLSRDLDQDIASIQYKMGAVVKQQYDLVYDDNKNLVEVIIT